MRLLLWAAVVALAGCASAPPVAPVEARPARSALEAFQLEGRIALRQDQENFSGGLSWLHRPAFDEILLTSPLGQGVARLTVEPQLARLDTSDQKHYEAQDAERLSVEIFGFELPVRELPYWVVGRARNAHAVVERDDAGRPARIREAGWAVEYTDYESEALNALPLGLTLTRADIRVRLRIDQWNLTH